jgi:ABC-type transport system involved in multi-copper enzyme maturation permease subunit
MKRIAAAIAKFMASPILIKELRATFRKWLFFWIFTGTLSLATVVILIAAFVMYSQISRGGTSTTQIGETIYAGLITTLTILLYLLLPGFCATFISGERAAQSYDILITSRLKPWEIVWGKTLAAGSYLSTFLLATLPLAAMCFLYGGITPGEILDSYLSLFASGMLIAIVSICVSGLFSSVVASVIVNYVVVLTMLLIYGGPATWSLFYSFMRHGPFAAMGGARFTMPLYITIIQWLIYAAIVVPFFIGAVNRVKPPSANRSTSLRVYSSVVILVFLLFLLGFGLFPPYSSGGGTVRDLTLFAIGGTAALFLPLFIILYPVEHNRQSVRVLRKMYGLPFPLRMYYPGGRSGVQFTIISVCVWFGLIMTAGMLFGLRPDDWDVTWCSAIYAVAFLVSYALIGFWLSTTGLAQWASRIILVAIFFGNMVLPLLVGFITTIDVHGGNASDSPLWYISPVGAIGALGGIGRNSEHAGFFMIPLVFHVVLMIIFGAFALQRSPQIRKKHLEAIAAMPLPSLAPVPALVVAAESAPGTNHVEPPPGMTQP